MRTQNIENMRCSKSSSKRVVCSNTILPQETRKTLNRQHNFIPNTTGKRTTTMTTTTTTTKLVEENKSKRSKQK